MKVTVRQEDDALIRMVLESLHDGTGTVIIDCNQGRIVQVRRQDAIKPTK